MKIGELYWGWKIINHCLVCFNELTLQIGWSALFSKESTPPICAQCEVKFQLIKGETCQTCSRPLAQIVPQYIVMGQCLDCVKWEEDKKWAGTLEKNDSVVTYNDFAQEVIARFKYRGDYILANVIAYFLKKKLSTLVFEAIVPIPLSEPRLYERGFNQSEAIILASGYEPSKLLTRTHTEKQSKKSRSERIHLPKVFQIAGTTSAKNILLIDDIYTTGSTLRHAAKILKDAGVSSVSSLTFARG